MNVRMVALAALLMGVPSPAFAFDFSQSQVVEVPDSYTGEVWVSAITESWEQTRNTVWDQCGKVLYSYRQPVTVRALIECEQQVALVNNRTIGSLGRLEIGERLVVPLSRWQVVERDSGELVSVDYSRLESQLSALRVEYEQTRNALQNTIDSQAAEMSRLGTDIAAVEDTLNATERAVNEHSTQIASNAAALADYGNDLASLRQMQSDAVNETTALNERVAGIASSLDEQQKTLIQLQPLSTQLGELAKNVAQREGAERELDKRVSDVESRITELRTAIDTARGDTSPIGWLRLSEIPQWVWWVLLGLVLILLIAGGVALAVRRHLLLTKRHNERLEIHHHELYDSISEVEKRVEALEESESFRLERDFKDHFTAGRLTEEGLNDLKVGESISLNIETADHAFVPINVYKRTDATGPYLELVGIQKGENVIHPRQHKGKPRFTLSQLYRRLKTAERQGKIIGPSRSRNAA